MGSKIGMALLALLLTGALLTACKPAQPMKAYQKTVTAADSLVLYQVEEYPTEPSAQQTGQYYLHDYATLGRQQLSAAEMKDLQAILIDPATFDSAAVKSCPMLAKMALDIRRKGKSTMTLVMSPAPCGKVLIFEGAHGTQPKSMELAPGNRLEAIVFGAK
jgi:hypothetical protein